MFHFNRFRHPFNMILKLSYKYMVNILVLVLLVLFISFVSGCKEESNAVIPLKKVKVWNTSEPSSITPSSWVGTIEPSEEVSLYFRVDGVLASKPVDIGSKVTKDQVVASLQSSHSHEDTAAVLAEYKDALAAEDKGRRDLSRIRELYSKGMVSRTQLEEVEATLATLNARKVRAAAQKSGALNISEFSAIKAPFDGVVTSYPTSLGQNVTSGQIVLKVASDTAEVQFNATFNLVDKLNVGSKVTVICGDEKIIGEIRYISPRLDDVTKTSLVRARLLPQDKEIFLGSTVTVLPEIQGPKIISIPASAIILKGDQPVVFVVVEKNMTIETRGVTIERYTADMVDISSGLNSGEKVVIAGVNSLKSGEKITLYPEAIK